MTDKTTKLICVHGNIGVGKSTEIEKIIKQLSDDGYEVLDLSEPISDWDSYLTDYYKSLQRCY